MIFDASHVTRELSDNIRSQVGSPFSIFKRWKMRGIEGQRFHVESADEVTTKMLEITANLNYCNVELRSRGVAIWFKEGSHKHVLSIPYKKLSLFQTDEALWVCGDEWKVKLRPVENPHISSDFVRMVMDVKKDVLSTAS